MALILSIETSTNVCSIALHNQGNLVAYQSLFVARSHAESLASMIHNMLQITHYKPKDVEAIAISEGPGSYTGLRIGAATATGLCYAIDIPLIAISTLEAMILAAKEKYINNAPILYCPMIDARRMEVYCMVADHQGHIIEEPYAHIVNNQSFEHLLLKNKVAFFGDGAEKCKSVLAFQENAIFIEAIYPSAEQVGTLAYKKFKELEFTDINYFSPIYLKPFQSGAETAKNNIPSVK